MNTVHKQDKEVVEVIKPNLQNGPWIAGGAVLKWYNNTDVGDSDIDVFCASKEQAEQVTKRIVLAFETIRQHESDNALTLGVVEGNPISEDVSIMEQVTDFDFVEPTWKVQIINRDYFNTVQDVINAFDITVCQIATAGDEWILGDTTAKDIRERNLRMNLPLRKSSAKRLVKYWTYGYRPVEGLIESFDSNDFFEKTVVGDYDF